MHRIATPAFGQGLALQGGPASLDQVGEGRGILLTGEEVFLLEDGGPKHGKIVVVAKQAAHVICLITVRRDDSRPNCLQQVGMITVIDETERRGAWALTASMA